MMDKIFIALQERAAADHGSEGTLSPNKTIGKLSYSYLFPAIQRIFSYFYINEKVSIFHTHLYFCNNKAVPTVLQEMEMGCVGGTTLTVVEGGSRDLPAPQPATLGQMLPLQFSLPSL